MTADDVQGFLRQHRAEHTCYPPDHAQRGDVWRCRCGKRYTCVDHVTRSGHMVTMRADWRRRWWPWPR